MGLLYALGALGIFVGIWCAAFLPTKIREMKWRAWLRHASATELAAECAKAARYMGFAKWRTGQAICTIQEWTERGLLSALEDLYEEAARADASGVSWRSSNLFMYYDGRFGEISELLRDRLGIPQPWDRHPPATPR
jgi:hypothetical protein